MLKLTLEADLFKRINLFRLLPFNNFGYGGEPEFMRGGNVNPSEGLLGDGAIFLNWI